MSGVAAKYGQIESAGFATRAAVNTLATTANREAEEHVLTPNIKTSYVDLWVFSRLIWPP